MRFYDSNRQGRSTPPMHTLRAGERYDTARSHPHVTIAVTADAHSAGRIGQLPGNPGDGDQPTTWKVIEPNSSGAVEPAGPVPPDCEFVPTRWRIICDAGTLSIGVA
jgi:hypothetical protein